MKSIVINTGHQFGFWSVIGPEVRQKRLMLSVRCKCGWESLVSKDALLHSKSKGCISCTRAKQATGEQSPSWKGGRQVDENGYVLIYQPEHPRSKTNGYIREHTIVMETVLGRLLTKTESVHHKNGERADNRPENLELWSTSQPFGQRVEDKVKWAKEILEKYEPEYLNSNRRTTS